MYAQKIINILLAVLAIVTIIYLIMNHNSNSLNLSDLLKDLMPRATLYDSMQKPPIYGDLKYSTMPTPGYRYSKAYEYGSL